MTGAAGPEPPGLERDLGAIRRSGELIEMLASRSVPAAALADPAVAVLSRLTADVDAAACPAALGPAALGPAACPAALGPAAAVPGAGRTGPRHRHRAGRARHGDAWPHAAAAAAVAAAIAALTAVTAAALMLVGMCARLSAARTSRRPRY